ncbi:hypothetical protein DFJ73DRAFT_420167 [Zopfochytrium polystomum]|nr:hypothetical protein DFJ73DRAFT_420167 [Zopfochytrium polystomum]
MAKAEERNQQNTCYVGNLDEQVSEALLWELMLQAGPVVNIHMPKDRVTQSKMGFGFVEYMSEEDADYAIKIMNMVKLYGKPIRVNKATADKKIIDVGATLFLGNLDPDVDEKLLYDTFSAFGVLTQTPKVARDPELGISKGYGFVSYDNFESSDAAIEAMNSQFLMNKPITVSYAFKKDGKGERHGSAAERLIAAQAQKNNPAHMPNRIFADLGTAGQAQPVQQPLPIPPAMPMVPPQGMPQGLVPVGGPFGAPPGLSMFNFPPPVGFGGYPPPTFPGVMPPIPGMAPQPGFPPFPSSILKIFFRTKINL